jgi:hypothetical protein
MLNQVIARDLGRLSLAQSSSAFETAQEACPILDWPLLIFAALSTATQHREFHLCCEGRVQ